MEETPKPAPVPLSRWIARIMVAVILAEGIWGLLVSLTRDLIVPFLARQMGADPQSALYLGKGDFDFAALFIALLDLCFAGVTALLLYAWSNRQARPARTRTVIVRKTVAAPAKGLSITPSGPATPNQIATARTEPAGSPQAPATAPPMAAPVPPQQPAKAAPVVKASPAKPAKPKEVYYNLVGEPINPTEDE